MTEQPRLTLPSTHECAERATCGAQIHDGRVALDEAHAQLREASEVILALRRDVASLTKSEQWANSIGREAQDALGAVRKELERARSVVLVDERDFEQRAHDALEAWLASLAESHPGHWPSWEEMHEIERKHSGAPLVAILRKVLGLEHAPLSQILDTMRFKRWVAEPWRAREARALDDARDRLQTIVDEGVSPHGVLPIDELLTIVEAALHGQPVGASGFEVYPPIEGVRCGHCGQTPEACAAASVSACPVHHPRPLTVDDEPDPDDDEAERERWRLTDTIGRCADVAKAEAEVQDGIAAFFWQSSRTAAEGAHAQTRAQTARRIEAQIRGLAKP